MLERVLRERREELLAIARAGLREKIPERPEAEVVVRGRREGEQALIEVEDQCGGLRDGQMEAMFAPFVQQNTNRSGLGLGLWLVQQVMAAHGGSVRAHNIPGQGCVFTLVLPAESS